MRRTRHETTGRPTRGLAPAAAHRTAWWDDVAWPVCAGTLAAVGLWGCYNAFGVAFVLGFFVALELALTPVAIDVAASLGASRRHAALVVVPSWAIGVEVVLGLLGAFGVWALPVVSLGAIAAPSVRSVVVRRISERLERQRVRREFDRMVAGMFDTSDATDGGPF